MQNAPERFPGQKQEEAPPGMRGCRAAAPGSALTPGSSLGTDPEQGTGHIPTALGTAGIPWKISHLPQDFPLIFPVSYTEGAAIRHITSTEQKGHDISDAGRIDYASDSWHV